MKSIIAVKFHDLDLETDYIATKRSMCQDAIDRGMYDLVMEFHDIITQGCMIAEPIYG